MRTNESAEMYLECILELKHEHGSVRSIDIVEHMGYSKPSVSRAVGLLKNGGYITVSEHGHIHLTQEGLAVAQRMVERHTLLRQFLMRLGVSEAVADDDACKIEHVISSESFEAIKRHAGK